MSYLLFKFRCSLKSTGMLYPECHNFSMWMLQRGRGRSNSSSSGNNSFFYMNIMATTKEPIESSHWDGMETFASNIVSCHQKTYMLEALMCSLTSQWEVAVKKAWVDMKVCSQYSVYFKQSAMIESLLPSEIHCWMLVVYGNSYVEEGTTVCCWARKYDEPGRAHLCDPEQSECPVTATSEFHMRKVWFTIAGRALKRILLSSSAFHRNMWVTLLIFFKIRTVRPDGLLAGWW